eukprot:1841687-Rhodomonas_salina.1
MSGALELPAVHDRVINERIAALRAELEPLIAAASQKGSENARDMDVAWLVICGENTAGREGGEQAEETLGRSKKSWRSSCRLTAMKCVFGGSVDFLCGARRSVFDSFGTPDGLPKHFRGSVDFLCGGTRSWGQQWCAKI